MFILSLIVPSHLNAEGMATRWKHSLARLSSRPMAATPSRAGDDFFSVAPKDSSIHLTSATGASAAIDQRFGRA